MENPNKKRTGKHHILYKEKVSKFKIDIPIVNQITLYLSTFEENKVNLAEIIQELRTLDPGDNVKLIINSPGGYVTEGASLINTLLSLNVDIETTLLAQGASMGALVFCIGDRRVIYETSEIMFHNFSGGYVGKGGEIKDYISHKYKHFNNFFKAFAIGLSNTEMQKMFDGKEYWFDAEEMCRREIATHVNISGVLVPAKKYLKILKKAKKMAKKEGFKINTLEEALNYGIDVLTEVEDEQQQLLQTVSEQITELVAKNDLLYT